MIVRHGFLSQLRRMQIYTQVSRIYSGVRTMGGGWPSEQRLKGYPNCILRRASHEMTPDFGELDVGRAPPYRNVMSITQDENASWKERALNHFGFSVHHTSNTRGGFPWR